jgi:hypothetical protein
MVSRKLGAVFRSCDGFCISKYVLYLRLEVDNCYLIFADFALLAANISIGSQRLHTGDVCDGLPLPAEVNICLLGFLPWFYEYTCVF